jgi:hypothetical protein
MRLEPDTLILVIQMSNLNLEMGWARDALDILATSDEVLLMAVKKVVHDVLPRVIIGV